MTRRNDSPNSIVIIMPNWVGDVVMATPLIEAIHESYPQVKIDFILKPHLLGLMNDAPWYSQAITLAKDKSFWALKSEIAAKRYDWGISLPNTIRPAALMLLGKVKRRIGYARNGRSPMLTDRLPFPYFSRKKMTPFRMVDFYGKIGELLGAPNPVRPVKLYVRDEVVEKANQIFEQNGITDAKPVIGINPGAKYGSSKLWPAEHFAETADRLAKQTGHQIAILAGPGEDELAVQIRDQMKGDAVALPSEDVDLETLKAVVKRLDLMVTNDTGPRQIAAAFDVPNVAIFGPTHTTWGNTGFEQSRELFIEVDCGPCMERTCPLAHHKCMTDLKPDRVVAAAMELMA